MKHKKRRESDNSLDSNKSNKIHKRKHNSESISSASSSEVETKHKKRRESKSIDSSDDEIERRKLKKLKKDKKKAKKLKKQLKKELKIKEKEESIEEISVEIPLEFMHKAKAPMTKEEWDKQQSVVRKIYDESTGRYRLIKGDGEVIEEIVSKDRHKSINEQATKGDGNFFQATLKKSLK